MKELIQFIYDNWDGTLRHNTEDTDTLIGLPKPYTVPSINDRFNELYYWDTYFTNVGLILSGKLDYAINNTENISYLIDKFGFMPNGNRTYYTNRSQPPFFSLMVRDIYDRTKDKAWLSKMYESAKTEYNFWQTKRTTPTGLNRYYHNLERNDLQTVKKSAEYFCRRHKADMPEDEEQMYKYAQSVRVVCESGWDCTTRCGIENYNFNWIDLNCLLYAMEENMAYFADELLLGDGELWHTRAKDRLAIMNKLCISDKTGAFTDYDFVNERCDDLISASSFYAMFVGACTDAQAAKTVALLSKLEQPHGLACCEGRDDIFGLQWDYPHGWACIHYIVITGLLRYGYTSDAKRIAEKYCATVEYNFQKTGNVWEHYDTVTGEVSVTKEKSYQITMMGWSAGVYLYCRSLLDS